MILPQKYTNKGYTLIETLVAVLILTLAVVAPMTIASRTLFSATVAREQVTAFYLAQEAVEGVRNVRDKNGLSGNPWLTGFPTLGTDFVIDIVNTTLSGSDPLPAMTTCAGTCAPIKYDSSTHLYQHLTGTDSQFTRTVRVTGIDDPTNPQREASISVTITWSVGGSVRSFVARENIFNWQ